ncbi:MAG: methionyl-tRNA formyltransferase [Woeseiaceae bacterium]
MKIIFAGTPDFACEALAALVAADFVPELVLTQPDRPAGRGKKLAASPVKQFAERQGIEVWQPVTLKDAAIVADLAGRGADLMIVAAYGLLLPQAVLDLPRLGAVNVHASLLPRWHGASPIQAAILAGDTESGISLMQMDAGLDSGPVIAAELLPIGEQENAGSLHDRLAKLGGSLLVRTLPDILAGRVSPAAQDPSHVTHAGKFNTKDALLDWMQPADLNARKVRAFNPHPGAWFELDGERIKCWAAGAIEAEGHIPGTVVFAGPDGIEVACKQGILRMTELQRPGRRHVTAAEFASQLNLAGKRLH